jgi:hypothetical protein
MTATHPHSGTVIAPVLRHSGTGSRPPEPGAGVAVTRGLLGGVAAAAGIVGVAMLLWPGSTGRYFSWRLSPAPVASFVGAFYVASAIVFGWAATFRSWTAQRGLCTSVLGLAAPTIVVTAVHSEVFDFGRWQAVAWVVLFAASVTSFATLVLARGRAVPRPADGPDAPAPARAVLAVLALLYGTVAVVLWLAPGAVSDHGPIAAGPMGLRFLGSWAAFLALCARSAGVHATRLAARLPIAALVAFPIAGTVATTAHVDDLRAGPASGLLAALAALAIAGLSVQRSARRVAIQTTRGGAVR